MLIDNEIKTDGQPTGGILIPDGWTTVFVPKYGEGDLYICPVRSCRKLHESASNLKAHFNVSDDS